MHSSEKSTKSVVECGRTPVALLDDILVIYLDRNDNLVRSKASTWSAEGRGYIRS